MQTSTFKTTPNKIYSLDETTRFLMRVRAMEDNPILQSNRKFHTIEELKSHLNTIEESRSYFTDLKGYMGTIDDGKHNRRRTPLKLKNVWKKICNIFCHHLTAGRYSTLKDVEFVACIFGFSSIQEMEKAAMAKGYIFTLDGNVSTDTQDRIANAFGYENWLKLADEDDSKYFVSETLLQRAYGRYTCNSALSLKVLNYISQYICDMNWQEYNTPEGRKRAYESIINRVVKPQMKTVVGQLYAQSAAKTSSIPDVKEGDRITITHSDGTHETYEYINGEYHHVTNNSEMCA